MCWSASPTPTRWKSWRGCCPGMLSWSGLQKKWRSTVKGKWVVLTADTLLRQRIELRYGFIEAHRDRFSTALMCRVFEVSRSGYYEWRTRPPSQRAQEDQALKASIRKHHEKSRATYGARRIQKKLAEDGDTISRRRVGRLMDEEGLECKIRRKFKATT